MYAEATLIAEDDGQSAKQNAGDKDEPDKDKNDEDDDQIQQDLPAAQYLHFLHTGGTPGVVRRGGPKDRRSHDPGVPGLCPHGTAKEEYPAATSGQVPVP